MSFDISAGVDWSVALTVPMKYANLTELSESASRGIDQAARGEGVYLDASTLPTEDDECETGHRGGDA